MLSRIIAAAILNLVALAALAQQPSSSTSNSSPSTQSQSSSSSTPLQSQSSPSSTQAQQANQQQQPFTSEEELRQIEKQRALHVVPLFELSNAHTALPLTPKQKFRLMARTMIDPFTFVSAGITAGIGQASDSFVGYGQGASGFGKRYGAAFADNADSNFFSNFVYPVIFKQDPRYLRIGQGTVKKRLWYAIEMEFVAKKDFGGYTFNYSNVLGAFTAGTISNAYYPSSDRGFGLTAGRAATALGYGTLGDVLLEFWPDIDQKVFHRHSPPARLNEPPGTPPK